VGRARGFGRGQAELLAVMAMALVLAVLVAAVVRFAVLYQQARSGLEEKAREVYRVVLSGGVRGYVDTSTSTVYMSAGVSLVVYAVYIHNGTHVLWGSQVPPPYPSYATSQTAALSLSDYYTAVYQGSLARQVSNCSAWVVLVTDKGVFKWCPTYITLYATSLAVESPANPLGKFKAYYAGNLTYFALFGELTGGLLRLRRGLQDHALSPGVVLPGSRGGGRREVERVRGERDPEEPGQRGRSVAGLQRELRAGRGQGRGSRREPGLGEPP